MRKMDPKSFTVMDGRKPAFAIETDADQSADPLLQYDSLNFEHGGKKEECSERAEKQSIAPRPKETESGEKDIEIKNDNVWNE